MMKQLLASLALGLFLTGTAVAQAPAGHPAAEATKPPADNAPAKGTADTGAAKAAAETTAVKNTAQTGVTAAKADVTAKSNATGATIKSALDLNTASEADLAALPGVGDDNAKKIIAARPFSRKDQLVSKKVLAKPDYAKVKDLVVAKQPAKQPAKK